MPALDRCHAQVVRALEKAGWKVNLSPYVLYFTPQRRIYIDIYAHHENGSQSLIIAEVKCFTDERSELVDLYTAVGQYIIYRNWLKSVGASEKLYLAIPTYAYYQTIRALAANVISENRIKMIVVDVDREVIEQWLG